MKLPSEIGPEARIPKLAAGLVRLAMPEDERDAVLGDLAEEYSDRVEQSGGRSGRARAWYWRQVAGCVGLGLWLRWRRRSRLAAGSSGSVGVMQALVRDVRHGMRSIRRSAAFSLVVGTTLALGIAATTIVFSIVDGVVLNPFPFPDPDRLVGVGTMYPRLGPRVGFFENMSPAEYIDVAEGSRTLERVVAWDMGNRQVTFGEVTENLFSAFWWGDAFATLGVRPVAGRGFTVEEIERGDRVAILSYRVWQSRFGGEPSLVGGTILMNGEPYTVVGIMPPRTSIYGTDLWLPMGVSPAVFPRNRRQFQVLGRMAAGVSLAAVNSELAAIAGRVEAAHGAEFEEYEGWAMRAETWNDINVRNLRPAGMILVGAVAFVLLLVCANVASLLLARGAARRRELAVRAALGAGRGRMVGQVLTESVELALFAGVVGVALGWLGVGIVSDAIASLGLRIPGEVAVNGRVLGVSAAVSVAAGLAFGAMPAVHAVRSAPQRSLQADSPLLAGSRSRLRLQRVFVGIEVALALVLLAGSGLLVSSFVKLGRVEPGFEPANVLTMRLTLAWQRYDRTAIEPFFQELRERVGAIAGVSDVATTSQFAPLVFSRNQFVIEGAVSTAESALPVAYTTVASPGYFDALRIPLSRGRAFTEADRAGTPLVAVINEAAAQRYFPGQQALGRRIRLLNGDWIEIVGVVGSTRNVGLERDPEPELFASTLQQSGLSNQMFLVVRTEGSPRSVLPAIREAVHSLDPEQPVYLVRTLEEAISGTQTPRRVSMAALTAFGVFALLLAAVGIYAVVAYAASQRTREIGVRMALGAESAQVRRLVVRQALVPVGIGVVIGMVAAAGFGRVMSSLLFGVSGNDPVALGSAGLLLSAAAALASYLPALRASGLDPVTALRPE